VPRAPFSVFTWHDRVEEQHARHTWQELEEEYFSIDLNEAKFIRAAKEMLDGVQEFWHGLNRDRIKKAKAAQKMRPSRAAASSGRRASSRM